MTQDDVNSGFSGRLNSLELQMTDANQQILFRPTLTTYDAFSSSLNQQFTSFKATVDDLKHKYDTFTRLFVDFRYNENQRHNLFTGHSGTSHDQGHTNPRIVSVTGNYTFSGTDYYVLFSGNSTYPITGTLPSGQSGKAFYVLRLDGGSSNVLVTGQTGQVINGSSGLNFSAQYTGALLVFNGNTGWNIMSRA